jgi:leader peptidase (prepilin peptidase) / N-methyltransferase
LCTRWPLGESVINGRSRCDDCGKTIAAYDLIPLFSYVLLKGKCRHCHAPIGGDAIVIELAALVIGIVPAFLFPPAQAFAAAIFGCLLLPLIVLDIRHLWLPDRLVLALAIGGILLGPFLMPEVAPLDRLLGYVGAYGALEAIRLMYRTVRKREGMGAGDPKIFAALGVWLGWQALPLVLLLASGLGLLWALGAKLLTRDAISAVAFGAVLGAGSLFYIWSRTF